MEKTNVMRILDQKKINYKEYYYGEEPISGVEVAEKLNQDEKHVYKTLVTVSKSKKYYVFMIPVAEELDLKKCAKATGEKSVEMIPQKDLLPLTGYVHGGCSPIGMKKEFKTTIQSTALNQEAIIFSAGKVGYQVELNPKDLEKLVRLNYYDIIKTSNN